MSYSQQFLVAAVLAKNLFYSLLLIVLHWMFQLVTMHSIACPYASSALATIFSLSSLVS